MLLIYSSRGQIFMLDYFTSLGNANRIVWRVVYIDIKSKQVLPTDNLLGKKNKKTGLNKRLRSKWACVHLN